MSNPMTVLGPCPRRRCGGSGELIRVKAFKRKPFHIVRCDRCGQRTVGRYSRKLAVTAWNNKRP